MREARTTQVRIGRTCKAADSRFPAEMLADLNERFEELEDRIRREVHEADKKWEEDAALGWAMFCSCFEDDDRPW